MKANLKLYSGRERKAERHSKWFMVEIDGKAWTSLTVVGKLVGQEIGG